jgi:acyl-CoA reductase-like NAD-dependent aldehyde dehydrogenase
MARQTVNPYGNQVVASVDDLTNEQFANLIAQAQKTFGSSSQKTFGERAAVCGLADVGVALVTVHHHNRQPEEEQ